MLTSVGLRGDAQKCREIGIRAYLAKPINEAELFSATKLVLCLPARETKTEPMLVTTHSLRERCSKLSILVAEDNRVNQALAVRLLEKQGHTVALAATGKAALEAIEKQAFDLVLMDIQMPEMDGIEATRAIRLREKSSGIRLPIIAVTANAMIGDEAHCLESGMDGYLSKPLSPKDLFAVIDTLHVRRV
jgi:two-component system sensor histidine kinase/response regulator